MGILDDFYKFMSPGTMEERVIQEKKPVSSTEKVDPREMQQLYQQMLQDSNRPITNIELEREVEDKTDNIEAELEAQNTEKLSDMYETIKAGAGEFGTGEYKGPTKKQLGLTPKVIVDEGPQDFMVKEEPVVAEQSQPIESLGEVVVKPTKEKTTEKKSNNIIKYDSGLIYNKDTDRYDTPDPIASAIMFAESSGVHKKGDKVITSEDDAVGLMQLLPKSFANPKGPAGYGVKYKMTKEDLRDPEKNYIAGRDYIYGLIDYWKGKGYSNEDAFDLGVMSYNAGVPKVNRYLKQVNRKGKSSKVVMEDDTQTYLNNVYKALGTKPTITEDKETIYKKIKQPKEYKKIK